MLEDEKLLLRCRSPFQQIFVSEDERGLRTLRFDEEGPRQSVMDPAAPGHLELPYARVALGALAFGQEFSRALVVGLGGGSLPRFLHHHFPELMVEAVEIDAKVVEVAQRYCGLELDTRLRVQVADARDFMEAGEEKYDLVVLDCFEGEAIPEHLASVEFLRLVRARLTAGGVVAANIWGPGLNALYGDMLATYRAAFADIYILDVPGPGTKIFVGLPREQAMSREELRRRCEKIGREHGFAHDQAEAIRGFLHASEEAARGVVLRDPA